MYSLYFADNKGVIQEIVQSKKELSKNTFPTLPLGHIFDSNGPTKEEDSRQGNTLSLEQAQHQPKQKGMTS